MSYTPEQLREIVDRIRHQKAGADWYEVADIIAAYADVLELLLECEGKLVAMTDLRVTIGDRPGSPQETLDWTRELARELLARLREAKP